MKTESYVVSVSLVPAIRQSKQLTRRGSTSRHCELLLGAAAFSHSCTLSKWPRRPWRSPTRKTQVLRACYCYAEHVGCILRPWLNSYVRRACLHQAESISSHLHHDDAFYHYTVDGMPAPLGYAKRCKKAPRFRCHSGWSAHHAIVREPHREIERLAGALGTILRMPRVELG